MANKLELKSIKELLDYNFFIPDYQRGYRWTDQQVKDLLEDVTSFALKGKDEYEFYCIQPLAVKEMKSEEKERNNLPMNQTWYEVIDGQQRLTTILLILSVLQNNLKGYGIDSFYNLKYARQNDISSIIDDYEKNSELNFNTVDEYYITNALEVIKNWKKSQISDSIRALESAITSHLPDEVENDDADEDEDSDEFDDIENRNNNRDSLIRINHDKARNVRFIWYEADENEDPIKIFTRLNIGKIALTNSELIKALFLNRGNFTSTDNNHLLLRQQEISSEWDFIENTLQNEEFWLFLNQDMTSAPTRIDMIFNLIEKYNKLELTEKQLERIGDDEYKTFRYFYEYFTSKKSKVLKCWEKVRNYFYTFLEWYEDIEIFHYIGYLIQSKVTNLENLINKWDESEDKSSFTKGLKLEIKKYLERCPALDFQYKVDGSDKGKCKPILLFHNVQTAINQNKESKSGLKEIYYRFPFHLYKQEGWDVEHINSNTTNPESDSNTQQEWLVNIYLSADEETKNLISEYIKAEDQEIKNSIYSQIKSRFKYEDNWTQDEKNKLWNYALLDSSTNRSYGNAIFSAKRRVIIGKEQGKEIGIPQIIGQEIVVPEDREADSCFVPICTKHVFLKYYSPMSDNNNYWTKEVDAPRYLKDIENSIAELDQ